jgi:hypothetical protein
VQAMKNYFSEAWVKVKGAWVTGKTGWTQTWKKLKGLDATHFGVSVLLLAGAWVSLGLRWSGWPAVIGIYVYLVGLLLLAACRCHTLLPDRLTALAIVPLTFFALIFAFATIFLKCDCFVSRELHIEPKRAAVTVSRPPKLPDAVEATYVSLAVITTAAPDYAPTTHEGRSAVAWETVSGLLFLLVAFPILAARLALLKD